MYETSRRYFFFFIYLFFSLFSFFFSFTYSKRRISFAIVRPNVVTTFMEAEKEETADEKFFVSPTDVAAT